MMGGSDGERKPGTTGSPVQAQAKMALPISKVGGTSEDLAATIADLNKSQLNMQAQIYGTSALDVKLLGKQLTEISTNAMGTAELASMLADGAADQADGAAEPAGAAGKSISTRR